MPKASPVNKAPQFFRMWLVLPLAAYVLMPTHNYYWDGVAFAIQAEKHLPLREYFFPTHLIYSLVHAWLFRALMAAGVQTRALYIMQYVNSLLAAGCAPLIYRALNRRLQNHQVAIAGALFFSFSATWWRFASDANAYVPSVFLILCALDLLDREKSPLAAGLFNAAAMLFHQLAILFLPIALIRLKDNRQRAMYLLSSLLPVSVSYALAYRCVSGNLDPGGFLQWLVAAPPVGVGKFSFQPLHDLHWTLLGTLRLLFGGKLDAARSLPIPSVIALVLMVLLLLWRFRRTGSTTFTRPSRDLLIWVAIYVGFLFFWMPQNTFYRMFYLAPLVLVIVGSLPRISLLCAVLFLWNGIFLVYPESKVQNNVPLRFALQQGNRWPTGTPIAFSYFHSDLWVISYFNPQVSWIGMPKLDVPVLDKALDNAHHRLQTLWLEASAYEALSADPEGRRWLQTHPVETLLQFRDGSHSFRFYEMQ